MEVFFSVHVLQAFLVRHPLSPLLLQVSATLFTAMRDGPLENELVGTFADWRNVTCATPPHLSLLGFAKALLAQVTTTATIRIRSRIKVLIFLLQIRTNILLTTPIMVGEGTARGAVVLFRRSSDMRNIAFNEWERTPCCGRNMRRRFWCSGRRWRSSSPMPCDRSN